MLRLRVLNVPHAEIARQLGVCVRVEMRHWKKAKKWLQERSTGLDPTEFLTEGLESWRMLDEKALAGAMNVAADARWVSTVWWPRGCEPSTRS